MGADVGEGKVGLRCAWEIWGVKNRPSQHVYRSPKTVSVNRILGE